VLRGFGREGQALALQLFQKWLQPLTPSLSHPSTFLRVAPSRSTILTALNPSKGMVEGPQGERERQKALCQFFGDLFGQDLVHGQGTNHYTTAGGRGKRFSIFDLRLNGERQRIRGEIPVPFRIWDFGLRI